MSGVQAAFYVLCYAADAANFWRGGNLLPLPWERAGVRAFAALDYFGRTETLKSEYGGDTPCSSVKFLSPFGFAFPQNGERRVKTLQKAACTPFFAYNTPCPTLFRYSEIGYETFHRPIRHAAACRAFVRSAYRNR